MAVGDDGALSLWRVNALPKEPSVIARVPRGSYSATFAPQGMLAASDGNEVAVFR